jgi:hypothetical protein
MISHYVSYLPVGSEEMTFSTEALHVCRILGDANLPNSYIWQQQDCNRCKPPTQKKYKRCMLICHEIIGYATLSPTYVS